MNTKSNLAVDSGTAESLAATPGPWRAIQHYSDSVSVVDGNGFQHVEAHDIAVLLDYQTKLDIQHWADSALASRELTPGEQAANARLIAAAPELLDALEWLVALMPDPELDADPVQRGFVRKALAAIAKTTGAQP